MRRAAVPKGQENLKNLTHVGNTKNPRGSKGDSWVRTFSQPSKVIVAKVLLGKQLMYNDSGVR